MTKAIDIGATPSREQACSRIARAESLDDLFELSNQALGAWREGWGDDLKASAGAARLWGGLSFPASCAAEVPVLVPGGKGWSVLDGGALERAGLEAAKIVVLDLLIPMPSVGEGDSGSKLVQAAESISKKLEDLAKSLGEQARPAENKGVSRRLGKEGLVGQGGLALDPDRMKAWDDGGIESWEALRGHLGTSPFPKPSQPPQVERGGMSQAAGVGALRGLCDEGGFSVVAAGPLGGMAQASEGALVVGRACRDLAEAIGAPSARVAGLGGLGVNLNCDIGQAEAFYSKSNASLTFGKKPQSLGHEWTHAFESTLQRFSAKTDEEIEAGFAVARFRQAVVELAGGEDLLGSEIDRKAEASLRVLSGGLATKMASNGVEEQGARAEAQAMLAPLQEAAKELARQWGQSVSGKEVFETDWREREWMSPAQSDEAIKAIRSFTEDFKEVMPEADDIQRATRASEIFAVLIDSAREVELLKSCADPKRSSFANYANFMEKSEPNPRLAGYWTSIPEMIARAAEGFFVGSAGRGALVEESRSKSFELPQGAERTELSARYAQAMGEAMPWLAKTCGFQKEFEASRSEAEADELKQAGEPACLAHVSNAAPTVQMSAVAALVARACKTLEHALSGARGLVDLIDVGMFGAPSGRSLLANKLAVRRQLVENVNAENSNTRTKAGPC